MFSCKFGLEEAHFQIVANTFEPHKQLFRSVQKVFSKCSGLQDLFTQKAVHIAVCQKAVHIAVCLTAAISY